MKPFIYQTKIHPLDARRDWAVPGNLAQAIDFSVEYFLYQANQSIEKKKLF